MTYNLTNLTSNANNWYEIATEVNSLSGGLLFTFVIVVLAFTYWATFKKQNFKDVFLAGNFFCALVSTIVWAMHLVNTDFLIIPYTLFFAALMIKLFNND